MKTRRYSELRRFDFFEDRYDYLSLRGVVGAATFGFDRWINQLFYSSRQWKDVRREVILRDNGCDLGVEGFEIVSGLLVHHMNPLTVKDIENGSEWLLDPEFLITTSKATHNAIHYGDKSLLQKPLKPRRPGDTRLW